MAVIERIQQFDAGLLKPQLKLKYKNMAQNPFRFFKGTAPLFYDDLRKENRFSKSPVCWLCGDMHIENFGSFKGDDKLVYFDINDFDEALLGPVLWDLVRAVASIFTAFYSLKIPEKEANKAAKLYLKRYASVLTEGKARYVDADTATGIVEYFLKKTRKRTQADLLEEMTCPKSADKIQIKKDGKALVKLDKSTRSDLCHAFVEWMKSNSKPPNHFEVVDVCFQSAGTGSLGSNRYLFLIRKVNDKRKFRLMDVKQATSSAVIPYVPTPQIRWTSQGERIVSIQKRMQYTSPAQLGTLIYMQKAYVIQQMQPTSDKVDFELIKKKFGEVCSVMKDMAVLTASAHLRSVSRQGSCSADELIAFGQDISWQEEVVIYAKIYSRKTVAYYKEFCKGYKSLLK